MNITIQGINLELTPRLRKLVEQKIKDSCRPLGGLKGESVKIAVELEQTTRRHILSKEKAQLYKAEATVWLPGQTLRVEESARGIEQAVIKLKHTLTRDIKKWRKHLIESHRDGGREMKNLSREVDLSILLEMLGELDAAEELDRAEEINWAEEIDWAEDEALTPKEAASEAIIWDEWEEDEIDARDLL